MRCPTCDTLLYLRDCPMDVDKILYCEKCFAYWPKVQSATEIEKLHKQIAALKAIVINERLQYNELIREQCDGYGPEYDTEEFARKELARELPEIDWGEL